ncbi:MAG: hypothetical protein ACYCTL_12690 [Acidimicrobiales bacterium]
MTLASWTVTYPNQSDVPITQTYPATGWDNTSPPIEAYCDGSPVRGSITYTFEPPANPNYRQPVGGWSWMSPPPSPPPLNYGPLPFTTGACTSANQSQIQGVSLTPTSPTSPSTTMGDGDMHTYYFTPTPICPAADPSCGVDTTLVWTGGTAFIGGPDGDGRSSYSSTWAGLLGHPNPRWQVYRGAWPPYDPVDPSIVQDTHYVYPVPSCKLAPQTIDESLFDEPCLSVGWHYPSNIGHPFEIQLRGQFAAVWAHWYFTVGLDVTMTMSQPVRLGIEKWISVPDGQHCTTKPDAATGGVLKSCSTIWQPVLDQQTTAWSQPVFTGTASASQLATWDKHSKSFTATGTALINSVFPRLDSGSVG